MQQPLIKLREIIWELTGKCLNNCSYCGSKEAWKEEINTVIIERIAENIAGFVSCNYPVDINFSGGDPLLVPNNTLEYCVNLLKEKGCKCKLISNPNSFIDSQKNDYSDLPLFKLFDHVGISINTRKEIDLLHLANLNGLYDNITYISNFNTSNIFLFDEILKEIGNKLWQIQFTVYKDINDNNAIYNSDEALEYLSQKVTTAINNGAKIIIADNGSNSQCGAGTSSIGILANGDVVPCLSMRSWIDDISKVTESTLLKESLEEIWSSYFRNYRYDEFKCCKDHCKNKKIEVKLVEKINKEDLSHLLGDMMKNQQIIEPIKAVYYGVQLDNVVVYGVGIERNKIEKNYTKACYYGVTDIKTVYYDDRQLPTGLRPVGLSSDAQRKS